MAKSDLQFESVKKRTEVGGFDGAGLTMVTRLYESNKMSAKGASRNAMALEVHDAKKKEMAT